MDRTDLAQDRNQWGGSCEHGNEHSCSIKCWIREYLNGFSNRTQLHVHSWLVRTWLPIEVNFDFKGLTWLC
jgi:hypothetical protein